MRGRADRVAALTAGAFPHLGAAKRQRGVSAPEAGWYRVRFVARPCQYRDGRFLLQRRMAEMKPQFQKYRPFTPVRLPDRQWPDRVIEKSADMVQR